MKLEDEAIEVCCAPDGLHCADKRVQRLKLTEELAKVISSLNGGLSPEEVRATLLAGDPVHTNFSRYWIETDSARDAGVIE